MLYVCCTPHQALHRRFYALFQLLLFLSVAGSAAATSPYYFLLNVTAVVASPTEFSGNSTVLFAVSSAVSRQLEARVENIPIYPYALAGNDSSSTCNVPVSSDILVYAVAFRINSSAKRMIVARQLCWIVQCLGIDQQSSGLCALNHRLLEAELWPCRVP